MAMTFVSDQLARAVRAAGAEWSFVNGSPQGAAWDVRQPWQVSRSGRGAGLGQAAGTAVGGALAHQGSGRLSISVIGDGDLLYTPSALWTASNLRLPLLTIVNNNRSYGNDEGHQEYLARRRGRPVENRGVGIFIENPDTSFADLARAFDVEGFGPVEEPDDLAPILERAVRSTLEGRPVLVDVRTQRRT
jgi:thiamine pyrophosphate-dependent acetolactate synthase large subunit-like protein